MLPRLFCGIAITLTLPRLPAAGSCPDRGFEFFEQEGYRTRNVRLSGFWLLPGALLTGEDPAKDLRGKAFTKRGILEGKTALRERMIAAPALFDSPAGVTVVGARVVNCGAGEDGVKELDIEYPLFTTKFPLGAVRTAEQTALEREHPAEALALAPVKNRFRVTPRLDYDASQNFLAGGRMEVRSRSPSGLVFAVQAQGSDKAAAGAVDISGTFERERGWIRQSVWRGRFEYADVPSDAVSLGSYRGLGQISLQSVPLGRPGVIVRFGSLIEGGHGRTGVPASGLPSVLLGETLFTNWKSYAGASARTGRTSMAASYGLLLGRTGRGGLVDYRKQVFDARYDRRFLVAPQRPVSVETRFNVGTLASFGPTPQFERFFGGNAETPFIPGPEWAIRANPVMRGIPAFRLNRNAPNQAPGADRFAVLNLTASFQVFGMPIIPDEAARDPEVRCAIEGFMKDGAESLIPVYELDDPAQQNLFDNVREGFAKTTEAMEAHIGELEPSVPEELNDAYQTCAEKIGDLAFDAGNISKRTPWRIFLNPDPEERGIPVIIDKCLVELNGRLKDEELGRLGEQLKQHHSRIAEQVGKIDRQRARLLAEQTLAFPSVVMQTVLDEMTVVSVSPVVVFDAGRVGPDDAGWRSTRYSAGFGARLTLASSVSFEIGYAWNLRPRAWEGRGALFVGLRFIDLFGK